MTEEIAAAEKLRRIEARRAAPRRNHAHEAAPEEAAAEAGSSNSEITTASSGGYCSSSSVKKLGQSQTGLLSFSQSWVGELSQTPSITPKMPEPGLTMRRDDHLELMALDSKLSSSNSSRPCSIGTTGGPGGRRESVAFQAVVSKAEVKDSVDF